MDISANTGSVDNSFNFRVGSYSDGSGELDGYVDDVRVYARELTTAEIEYLYEMGAD